MRFRRDVALVLLALLLLAIAERAVHDWWLAPEVPADPSHPFWSADWQQQARAAWKTWEFNAAGTYSTHPDNDGLVKFKGGYRITTGQPDGDVTTVWMFGASTLLSLELPADETIPSLIQAALGKAYRVVNGGGPGATTFNQRKRMEDSPVSAGDWVVFYDGLVDVEVNIHRPAKQAISGDTCTTSFFALYHAFCAAVIPARISEDDIARAVAGYRREIELARQWAEARGARFLHILQPHTFSVPDQAHERSLLWDYPGLDVVSRRAWPAFQASETGLDLTHALDDCKRTGECWHFPFYHVNSAANKVIAAAIVSEFTAKADKER